MDYSVLPLFIIAVFMLAILPGPGVLITVASALNGGLSRASFTIAGIVLGDIIFILLVTLGLKVIAEHLTTAFIAIKYLGGAYLIWLGIKLIFSKPKTIAIEKNKHCSARTYGGDVIAGAIVTLSNPKAIVFYISFLPAFIDIPALTLIDIGVITVIITLTVAGAMLFYAVTALKAQQWTGMLSSTKNWAQKLAGGLITLTGGLIIVRQ